MGLFVAIKQQHETVSKDTYSRGLPNGKWHKATIIKTGNIHSITNGIQGKADCYGFITATLSSWYIKISKPNLILTLIVCTPGA